MAFWGLAGRSADFPVLAELQDFLRGKLARLLCPDESHAETLRGLPPARLERQFAVDAKNLDEAMLDILLNEVVDRLYQRVGEHLEPLPPVPVGKHGAVAEAWQEYRRADRSGDVVARGLPHFASDELFAHLTDPGGYQHFDGEAYLDLISDKVKVAVGQVLHSLRSRLRSRLGELEVELDRLLATDNGQG